MKFSRFYGMQIASPTRETERQLFLDCLEQAVFADQLGYDRIWAVEHHGLYEYAHSSAPETGERPATAWLDSASAAPNARPRPTRRSSSTRSRPGR